MGVGLLFLLIITAYLMVFAQVTTNPDKMKRLLGDSGLYEKMPAVIYDDAVKSESTVSASIPLKDQEVRQAALEVFNPGFVQQNIETVIDSTYSWLEGKTDQPEFSIDIQDAKNQFATSVSDKLEKRLQALPPCTLSQLRQIENTDDLFSLQCLPPGSDIASMKSQFSSSVANSDEFLKETKINPDTFKDENSQSLFDTSQDIPQTYQFSKKLPYILMVVIAVISTLIVFISTSRREGIIKLIKTFLIAGMFVLLIPLVLNSLADILLGASANNDVTAQLAKPIINAFNAEAAKIYYVMGGLYVLLAAAGYLGLRKFYPEKKEEKKK